MTLNRKYIILVLSIIILTLSLYCKEYVQSEKMAARDSIEICIPRGASLDQIADSLQAQGLIAKKYPFKVYAYLKGYDTRLRAGFFEVPTNLTTFELVSYLANAQAKTFSVTLIEGWSNTQIVGQLARSLGIDSLKFDSLCQDSLFIRSLNLNVPNLSGYLLPDTYALHRGMNEEEIIRFLVNRTISIFEADSVRRALEELNMNIHQILTLASIVEGECIFDDERAIVASVYFNRLARRMRLQADPTIQFILDGKPRRLLLKDLQIDSPYNTYKYHGIPPGPINNPGIKSIMATIFAEDTNYLYFVARGDGRHTFSKTLQEHNRAKSSFDKIRRDLRRKQNNQKTSAE
jgi:UPF0755 protein